MVFEQMVRRVRLANFLGAAQLYLRENVLLREPLRVEHLKHRPLGHWGTQPGLNLIYAHLDRLIALQNRETLLVVGPGHGAPAILANLWIEGTLGERDARFARTAAGFARLVREFSWPGGFASHLTPSVPGAIHEGGELGYSLAHAFGAAFDAPDRLVACVIGDGEAESGPLAGSWQSWAFLDPETSGAVLPILHLNEIKLSGPTVLGRRSDDEVDGYLRGLGYEPLLVKGTLDTPRAAEELHASFAAALDFATALLNEDFRQRRRPMIVLRTPKGMTGPQSLHGKPVEGTARAHQLPLMRAAEDPEELAALETWLRSYRVDELLGADGAPAEDVLRTLPAPPRRMGAQPAANGGTLLRALQLPTLESHAIAVDTGARGSRDAEPTGVAGTYLRDVLAANADQRNVRIVSPDETSSNHLQALFEVTSRAWMLAIEPQDERLAPDGRVMEVLSEHLCQGWLEGYLLTGRHGVFPCYEAFTQIVISMAGLFAKWLKMSSEVPWRAPIASLNYLLTSHVWRQDQDGYSHQGPGLIQNVMTKKHDIVRAYYATDANMLLAMMELCLQSRCRINIVTAGKHAAPCWLTIDEARAELTSRAAVWSWAGTQHTGDAEVVLACSGDVPTLEMLAAVALLREWLPDLRLRVVSVVDLFSLDVTDPQALDERTFAALFGQNTEVIYAFHGYPAAVHSLLHGRPAPERFHVHGYNEEGTTTTPFDMVVRNCLSRYHLVRDALARVRPHDPRAAALAAFAADRLAAHADYIRENGEDMPEIRDWRWRHA